MTRQQQQTIAHINEAHATERHIASQATRDAAALAGLLGLKAQLVAMSAKAQALRAAGDEAGYQAVKAEAFKLYEGAK